MTDRILITTTCYIPANGQPQIVLSGSVFDVADASAYRGVCTILSSTEASGALAAHGKPTSVRSLRTR